ncbi:MAG: class III cytochrome c [Desulfobulbus propionicus]|nr:MAG: class III cytochrome c [Desulfobulbus propionicus]
MKKLMMSGAIMAAMLVAGPGVSPATDKGPAELWLESTIDPAKKPKPAFFPHAVHQSRLQCGTCHHDTDTAGKKRAYVPGMQIAKCESCHNKASDMPKKLKTFKGAAHARCRGCHGKTNKALTKCKVCHQKK